MHVKSLYSPQMNEFRHYFSMRSPSGVSRNEAMGREWAGGWFGGAGGSPPGRGIGDCCISYPISVWDIAPEAFTLYTVNPAKHFHSAVDSNFSRMYFKIRASISERQQSFTTPINDIRTIQMHSLLHTQRLKLHLHIKCKS